MTKAQMTSEVIWVAKCNPILSIQHGKTPHNIFGRCCGEFNLSILRGIFEVQRRCCDHGHATSRAELFWVSRLLYLATWRQRHLILIH